MSKTDIILAKLLTQ